MAKAQIIGKAIFCVLGTYAISIYIRQIYPYGGFAQVVSPLYFVFASIVFLPLIYALLFRNNILLGKRTEKQVEPGDMLLLTLSLRVGFVLAGAILLFSIRPYNITPVLSFLGQFLWQLPDRIVYYRSTGVLQLKTPQLHQFLEVFRLAIGVYLFLGAGHIVRYHLGKIKSEEING